MKPQRAASVRSSGLLLHITSLPGPGGVGDLGPAAHAFVDQLQRGGQRLWQVLPLGPTGYGDSPYQSLSAFAGHPLFVSLEVLVQQGLLEAEDLVGAPPAAERADYAAAQAFRLPRLARAAERIQQPQHAALRADFEAFCTAQAAWLEDYALYMALKEQHGLQPWYAWPPPLRDRHPEALEAARQRLHNRLHFHRFTQWQFFQQWRALRQHAAERGVRLLGDMPMFVAHDSVEVWTEREQFLLYPDGTLRVQAGVPPDYFSPTGQLWGNPLYDWPRMQQDGFSFWRRRMAWALTLYDRVRIDHFRGFAATWTVPAGAPDATFGQWVQVPGEALFSRLFDVFGDQLDLVAEDLGLITPDVEALRDRFGLPGMRVIQFAFGSSEPEKVRPYSFPRRAVVYTSTHDNDTIVGWFRGDDHVARQDTARTDQRNLLEYLGLEGCEPVDIHWQVIRLALSTVADTVILPVQDVLGLGSQARMNRPGCAVGNWGFRLLPGQLTAAVLDRLRRLCEIYGRA
ncbi:MAG: 4-alpha-glucanotransferase [Myxococcales bacterium]|nr:4-alpha-glucanotransferase [Myxococcota bacterium]MDW8282151.1 4-alpha-glucanotransferase [Myxococcales bacterium]